MVLGITLLHPSGGQGAEAIKLPPPVKTGGMPLVEALAVRRTVRSFASRPLDLDPGLPSPMGGRRHEQPPGLGPRRGPGPPAPWTSTWWWGRGGWPEYRGRGFTLPRRGAGPDPRSPG